MMPLCRFCGERHPLLQCPDFDAIEKANVEKAEAAEKTKPAEEAWQSKRIPARVLPSPIELAPPIGAPSAQPKGEPAGGAVKAPFLRRSGRCLEKDRPFCLAATKPWKAEGMSRATWFRRQKLSPQLSPPNNPVS
jgi:hypothetical protein